MRDECMMLLDNGLFVNEGVLTGNAAERIRREDLQRRIDETVEQAWQDRDPTIGDLTTLSDVREFVTVTVEQFLEARHDFGRGENAPTREGQILGTPRYMAPEQMRGDASQLGRQTDIYALGVMLYEMLSGSVPHKATRIADLFQQIQCDSPPPLPQSLPGKLRSICDKCLAKSPSDRYETANSLADDLQAWLESDEAKLAAHHSSSPSGVWARARNFLRRTPGLRKPLVD
jgi:serine/threonine protein kinase